MYIVVLCLFFFFQAEDGIRDFHVTGVQTCALPISALGKQGHGLLLDCRTLESRYVPFPTQHVRLVVADTGVRRELAASEYNARRAECEAGVALLRRRLPDIQALRDVPAHAFEEHRHELPDLIARRSAHVIYENARVQATAD